MQFIPKNVKKFQAGGSMPAEEPVEAAPAPEEGAPAEGRGEDPMMMLAQGAAQALQSQNCEMAFQVCQALMQLIQQMSGGAPEEPQGEPVFKKGGVLLRRIKK